MLLRYISKGHWNQLEKDYQCSEHEATWASKSIMKWKSMDIIMNEGISCPWQDNGGKWQSAGRVSPQGTCTAFCFYSCFPFAWHRPPLPCQFSLHLSFLLKPQFIHHLISGVPSIWLEKHLSEMIINYSLHILFSLSTRNLRFVNILFFS